MSVPSGLLPPRAVDFHKGDAGRVVVVAGSLGLTGAAVLCARGALRAGAGLVTMASPRSVVPILASMVAEAMTRPLPETKEQTVSLHALAEAVELAQRADAVVIGPGLSTHAQTKQLVRHLLPRLTKPCVVDADGLNALAEDLPALKRLVHPMILTPHPGEMARLAVLSVEQVRQDRERIAREFAKHYRVILVLKGHRTITADVGGAVTINDTGGPAMATGGAGDVLAGVIAAFLGQGLAPFDAARLAVHVHGLAGDLAASARGHVGLIASDLVDTIPEAIRAYQQTSFPGANPGASVSSPV